MGRIGSREGVHEREVRKLRGIFLGSDDGIYLITDIVVTSAPAGSYTFVVLVPTAGEVSLYRDGVFVMTVNYNWLTTIWGVGWGIPYSFGFSGYFVIDVAKSGPGSQNLYSLDSSFFDGCWVLEVT